MLTSILFFIGVVHGEPLCKNCNVLVIALDAVQAKHVHYLGAKNPTTPNLDRLAKQGYAFHQAISPASWTVPAYLSVFSSMYPSSHGLVNRYTEFTKEKKTQDNFVKRQPQLQTMAQIFKANGYKTGGFTGDAGISAILGYDKGYDKYTDETQFGGLENSTDKALKWLSETKPEKFFLFVHGYDSHGQFALPGGFKSRFQKTENKTKYKGTKEEQAEIREAGLAGKPVKLTDEDIEFWRTWYDGKIADADERVGKLLSALEKGGYLKNTVIVVFSDHGTEFYEHGRFDHGYSLYDELIHVPYIIKLPNQKAGKEIKQQVGTISTLPTLMDVVGFKADEILRSQMQGTTLLPYLQGKGAGGNDVYIETDYRNHSHKRALRSADGWKYIQTLENGTEELYNLKTDPAEKINLNEKEKARLAKMKAMLQAHLNRLPAANLSTGCVPAYKGQCEYYQ
jgi:arylsulfatase A-like enzyme